MTLELFEEMLLNRWRSLPEVIAYHPKNDRIHATVAGFVYAIQSRFYKSILNKTHPPH
jgi:hypothetical protein